MPRLPVLLVGLVVALAGCGGSEVVEVDGGYLPIPDVVGQSVDNADQALRDALLTPVHEGAPAGGDLSGCEVAAQRPGPDEFAEMDQRVTLQLTCPPAVEQHSAPSVSEEETEAEVAAPSPPPGAYAEGFKAGCRRLFRDAADGTLYASNVPYTVEDCVALLPDDVPDGGRAQGRHDGCVALFERAGVGGFGAGDVVVTATECPAA